MSRTIKGRRFFFSKPNLTAATICLTETDKGSSRFILGNARFQCHCYCKTVALCDHILLYATVLCDISGSSEQWRLTLRSSAVNFFLQYDLYHNCSSFSLLSAPFIAFLFQPSVNKHSPSKLFLVHLKGLSAGYLPHWSIWSPCFDDVTLFFCGSPSLVYLSIIYPSHCCFTKINVRRVILCVSRGQMLPSVRLTVCTTQRQHNSVLLSQKAASCALSKAWRLIKDA